MQDQAIFVVFRVGPGRYCLPLASVVRIVHAVELAPLPGAPGLVLGAMSMEGLILPVFGLRRLFGLEERPVQPSDRFVIARTPRRTVALAVDDAEGVVERAQSSVAGILDIAPGSSQIRGVLPLEDGLVLVHDLEKLLSKDDEGALEAAMGKEAAGGA